MSNKFKVFKKEKIIKLTAPMTGEALDLKFVPDDIFAEKIIGDGIAILPKDNIVLAPCDGKIIQLFPTKHALGILTDGGLEILVHIGIDTVNLKGKGFKSYVFEGDKIYKGDKLLEIDSEYIINNAKSIISPIIITNMEKVKKLSYIRGNVVGGKDLIMEISIK